MNSDPDVVLPLGAVGDLVAARRAARMLLGATGWSEDDALDTLIVAAACLEAELVTQDDVTRHEVAAVLHRLQADRSPGASFATSRSAFIRYVGAELGDLSPRDCGSRLSRLIAAVCPSAPPSD